MRPTTMFEATSNQSQLVDQHDANTQWGFGIAVSAVFLAFGIYIVGTLVLVNAARIAGATSAHRPHDLELTLFAYQFLVVGVAVSAYLLILGKYHLSPLSLGFRFPGWSTLGACGTAAVGILIGVVVLTVVENALLPGFKVHGNADVLFPKNELHIAAFERVLVFLMVAVEVPLTEETLFRGILFQGARTTLQRRVSRGIAIAGAAIVSGAVFGAAHLSDPRELHTLPTLILLGICLAYVFQYSRSVYGSALVHGIINGLAAITILTS